jgi:hypothetical protein
MADTSKFQQGVIRRYYEHFDTISLQKLSEIVSEIYLAEANKPVKLWEKARQLLSRMAAEDPRVAQIVAKKDIQGLARLANELNAGLKERRSEIRDQKSEVSAPVPHGNAEPVSALPAGSPSTSDPLSTDNLKRAMKAFRKRMKLTRLDDESRLGRSGNPMSSGRHSQVQAIMPPREFPKQVWDELASQGKLRTADGVFYQLTDDTAGA